LSGAVHRLAALDVGSNAIRLVIGRVHQDAKGRFLRREASYRVPLRLGDDVFSHGIIPPEKVEQMVEVFHSFEHLLRFFAPKASRACATSAMREAGNSQEVVQRIQRETGICLEVISGQMEAQLLFANRFDDAGMSQSGAVLFIDVGGGSTELTLMENGHPLASESFRVGTVRTLQGKVAPEETERMRKWVVDMPKVKGECMAIGTGGNIGKIFDLADHRTAEHRMSRKVLKEMLEMIEKLSYEDRIRELGLKPDRADVIAPAGRIYSQVMKWASCKEILIPNLGVSDGILEELFHLN